MNMCATSMQSLPNGEPAANEEPDLLDEALALVGRVNERVRNSTERFTSANRLRAAAATRVEPEHAAPETTG